jgi:hypothetical protein
MEPSRPQEPRALLSWRVLLRYQQPQARVHPTALSTYISYAAECPTHHDQGPKRMFWIHRTHVARDIGFVLTKIARQ